MPKTKWNGAEEPTINYFYKIDNMQFRILSYKCGSTDTNRISSELDRNTPWQQVSSWTHMIQHQRRIPSGENKLERDFPISKHHLISQRENVIYWLIEHSWQL